MYTALHATLIEYGLTEIEATIYLTLLEIGRGTTESIHGITAIDTHQISQSLDDMYGHAYVYHIFKDGIHNYIASNPRELIQNRKESISKLEVFFKEEKRYNFDDDLQHMKDSCPTNESCELEYHEGVSGLIEYYQKHIVTSDPIYAFISPDNIHPILIDYLYKEHVPQRVAKNVPVLAITDSKSTHQKDKYIKLDTESLRETLIIDHSVFHLSAGINMFGTSQIGFVMYSQEEMSALTIQSKELYESLQSIFLYIRNTYYTKREYNK